VALRRKWSSTISKAAVLFRSALPLFEIACVLVRFDHIACRIVNGRQPEKG
jgi:hypothetical protein